MMYMVNGKWILLYFGDVFFELTFLSKVEGEKLL